jgi:hypothetical protein
MQTMHDKLLPVDVRWRYNQHKNGGFSVAANCSHGNQACGPRCYVRHSPVYTGQFVYMGLQAKCVNTYIAHHIRTPAGIRISQLRLFIFNSHVSELMNWTSYSSRAKQVLFECLHIQIDEKFATNQMTNFVKFAKTWLLLQRNAVVKLWTPRGCKFHGGIPNKLVTR